MRQLQRVLSNALLLALVAVMVMVMPNEAVAAEPSVLINEFQAVNDTTLTDNTGEFEDWIELRNTSSTAVDLGGWTIAAGEDSFVFEPATTVPSNGLIVVFASGDPSRTVAGEIHLPFKLSSTGESLTLTDATGELTTPGWPAPATYPLQLADTSYGLNGAGNERYFTDPTPGANNGGGAGGVVSPVEFSLDRGFYDTEQLLTFTSATPNAIIRYTLDGSTPSATSGIMFVPGTPVAIGGTSMVRAVAVRDGWIASPVLTRTYLFASDILQQSTTVPPAGWPASGAVNGHRFDYGMDPNVVAGNEAQIEASLLGLPSISIVTDLDNLVDPATGIYVNPRERGQAWERPASIELIDPSGAEPGFGIEGAIRIRGGSSRSETNPKHAFRLFFQDSPEGQLDYPLFGTDGADSFEKVDLRTSQGMNWGWRRSEEATFVEDVFSRYTQRDMGQPYTRTRPYHLYLNGQYWGLYETQERVTDHFGESYFGGVEDDYDVIKRGYPTTASEASDGNLDALQSLWPLVNDLSVTNAEFAEIDSKVDLQNLADYYLVHFFTGDYDGSPSWWGGSPHYRVSANFYMLRNRTGSGDAGKWQFFEHDSEHSLCANYGPGVAENIDNTTPWNLEAAAEIDFMAPAWLHEALISHPAYRQVFQDRVQLHWISPGGALTHEANIARYNDRVAERSPAIEAHSARWGDGTGTLQGRAEWETALATERNCLSLRRSIVEAQLQEDGLWPVGAAPTIMPDAGPLAYGTDVTITDAGQGGTLWATVNGTDPRNTDGSPASDAFIVNGPISVTADMTVRARAQVAGVWSPLAESSYTLSSGAGPVTLALNEFNAVSATKFLGGGSAADMANGTDATLGRIAGNGGDWFELAVIEDGLDIGGWTVEIWNDNNGSIELDATLTFAQADELSNLRAGTLLTVSEDMPDDVAYDPIHDDWHLNLQSNNALAGAFITAGSQSNFAINNSETQIAIFDAAGQPVQPRTGEGTVPGVSVNSTEVFKLEGPPSHDLAPASEFYQDGTSSTFGLPNAYGGGAEVQDFSQLRIRFGDVDCDGTLSIGDALLIAQYSVLTRSAADSCPLTSPQTQVFVAAGDVDNNAQVDIGDALLIAQCTVGLANTFCSD